MIPTPGRIVEYTLGPSDITTIESNRKQTAQAYSQPVAGAVVGYVIPDQSGFPIRSGNAPRVGDTYPLVITRVWSQQDGGPVNGQVLLDGDDSLWVTSRTEAGADTPEYHWRPYTRVEEVG